MREGRNCVVGVKGIKCSAHQKDSQMQWKVGKNKQTKKEFHAAKVKGTTMNECIH